MDFKIDKKDGYSQVQVLNRRLDTHIAPELKSKLILIFSEGEKNILLNLDACTYCDSSGLSAILVANRLCKNADGRFVLYGLQPAVEKLIIISQLDTVLNVSNDLSLAESFMKNEIEN